MPTYTTANLQRNTPRLLNKQKKRTQKTEFFFYDFINKAKD